MAGLGIAPDAIKDAVTTLCERTQDREVKRRLQAVTITAKKFARGEPIAWRPFYDDAGVDPPTRLEVSAEVHRRLEQGIFTLFNDTWKGKKGNSAHLVYGTLLWFAWRFGGEHERGVEVAVSLRHLTLEANLGSKDTTRRALQYLARCGLVGQGEAPEWFEAGQFVLFFEGETGSLTQSDTGSLTQSDTGLPKFLCVSIMSPVNSVNSVNSGRDGGVVHTISGWGKGGLDEWAISATHPAFRQGALGHATARLFTHLLILDAPISAADLAQLVGCHRKAVYKPLKKLRTFGIIECKQGNYLWSKQWRANLDRAAAELGAYEARASQAATYDRERDSLRMKCLHQQHDTPFKDTDTPELVPHTKHVLHYARLSFV
jgi:predicted transcriptional regulator